MCYGCYEDAGKPLPTDRSSKAVPLIERVYTEVSPVGGHLHVQLEDYNLWDCFFEESELSWSKYWGDPTEIEQTCYKYLKGLSEEERFAAVAEFDGYVGL